MPLTLKFKVHGVSPVDDDTVRGVFLVPDYDDAPTRAVLGVAKGQKDASKLLLAEINGDQHVADLVAGREVTLTLEWGALPTAEPVVDSGAKKRKKE